MPPPGKHPDEVPVIILSSDDEGELPRGRGKDRKRAVEMAPTDSEESSDEESDSESSESDSEASETDRSEWIPCRTPRQATKKARVMVTRSSRHTKAQPVDSKLSNQRSKKSTKEGGNFSKRIPVEKKELHAKYGAGDNRTIRTKQNVQQCDDFRQVNGDSSPKQAVVHGAGDNPDIDRKEEFPLVAETFFITRAEFNPVFVFNAALRHSLDDYGNQANDIANDIDILATWYSREKDFHENGLSITLSDEEMHDGTNNKAEVEAKISVATDLTPLLDVGKFESRQQCREYMIRRLTEYRSSLHQIVDEINAKTKKTVSAAKMDSVSAIRLIVEGVSINAADCYSSATGQAGRLGSQ